MQYVFFHLVLQHGIEGVKYPGSYTLYFMSNPYILKFAIVVETIYALLYLIPIAIAFVHDLLYEEKPKYLLSMFIAEIFVFLFLRFIEVFGNNLVFLIFAIIALLVFGSFNYIIINSVGTIISAGVGLWTAVFTIGIPVVAAIFFIQCIIGMFG